MLFVFAAWCGVGGLGKIEAVIRSRAVLALAFAWLAFAFVIVMTWHAPWLEAMIPKWMIKAIYPIDKTDLDLLRLTHFLAVATVVTRFFPRKDALLASKWLRPLIMCGQHSLPIFCMGVFLSFGAHWILAQYRYGVWEQFAVSFAGMAIMVAIAWALDRAAKVPDLFVDAAELDERHGGGPTRENVIRGVEWRRSLRRQEVGGASLHALRAKAGRGRTGHAPISALHEGASGRGICKPPGVR